MPELRRRASVKNRSRSGPKKGQSGSAYLICCSLSGDGTAFGSAWAVNIPEKPQTSKNHFGTDIDSLRAREARAADDGIVNPRGGHEFHNIFVEYSRKQGLRLIAINWPDPGL